MSFTTFQNLPESKQKVIINSGIKVFASSSYAESSTDTITKECGISKGILFHYFGSKKEFYLYILEHCIQTLAIKPGKSNANEFYQILFDSMDAKMELYKKYPLEIALVNHAAKDTHKQIESEKSALISKYMASMQKDSLSIIQQAVATLSLRKASDMQFVINGLSLYVNTILMQYLGKYKNNPQAFFENSAEIKAEVKNYIDLFLYGIKEDKV